MCKVFNLMMVLSLMLWSASFVSAAEHGGKEHGGEAHKENEGAAPKEHGGTSVPSTDDIRNTMTNFVLEKSKETGTLDVPDPETGNTRKLELVLVHERVGKTGDYYYSCADFKDTETGQMLDLDLDVEDKGGQLSVVDVRIHKLDGKERYTYDENDNRIPLNTEDSQMEGSPMEDQGQEHGDKEHGGATHKEHGGK